MTDQLSQLIARINANFWCMCALCRKQGSRAAYNNESDNPPHNGLANNVAVNS